MDTERFMKYVAICQRAEYMGISKSHRVAELMDVESADLRFHMRLDEWLKANDLDFAHDFIGIYDNIKRDGSFPVTDFGCFVPRFAGDSQG